MNMRWNKNGRKDKSGDSLPKKIIAWKYNSFIYQIIHYNEYYMCYVQRDCSMYWRYIGDQERQGPYKTYILVGNKDNKHANIYYNFS